MRSGQEGPLALERVDLSRILGSGSTLIAAENTGRICRGVELDPLYVDVIVRRYEAASGTAAVLVETGETFEELEQRRTRERASGTPMEAAKQKPLRRAARRGRIRSAVENSLHREGRRFDPCIAHQVVRASERGFRPPSIWNAVFDATGVRLRSAPFTRQKVKVALEST